MGAWGFGPLESDAGLDALDRTARLAGEHGDDAAALVGQLLEAGDQEERYAAAGLVLAAATADWSGAAHAYEGLLDGARARGMLPAAVAAVDSLVGDREWLGRWFDADGIVTEVVAVRGRLEAAAGSAGT